MRAPYGACFDFFYQPELDSQVGFDRHADFCTHSRKVCVVVSVRMRRFDMNEILVPLAAADLIDRIVVLQLRLETTVTDHQHATTARQKALLDRLADRILPHDPELRRIWGRLYETRRDLYTLEEDLRACDERGEFGLPFVTLTRALLAARDTLDLVRSEIDLHLGAPLLANAGNISAHNALDL